MPAARLALDPSQSRVLAFRGPLLRVLGGPGTGKTTVAIELVADRVDRGVLDPGKALVLAATRRAAGELRTRIVARLAATVREPMARTPAAFAFAVLHAHATAEGTPRPRLITGAEQEAVLAELLAGHAAGAVPGPRWPEAVRPALATRGFRSELRDLLMRAQEQGVGAAELAELGRQEGYPQWIAAAAVFDEYLAVTGFARPGSYDPASVLREAAGLLAESEAVRADLRERVSLVVVDDAHELTSAGEALLRALAQLPVPLVLLGDPDLTTQSFRGADPLFLGERWTALAHPPGMLPLTVPGASPPTVVLERDHRQPPQLSAISRAVAARIGVVGDTGVLRAGSRPPMEYAGDPAAEPEVGLEAGEEYVGDTAAERAAEGSSVTGARPAAGIPSAPRPAIEVAITRSVAAEHALIAARLRQAHLIDALPWDRLAVVVRGRVRAAAVRRALAVGGVPVAVAERGALVRDDPAVRPLLTLLALSCALARDDATDVDPQVVADLLLSPIGGTDPVQLRRIRRALRQDELDGGGHRSADQLLAAHLRQPHRCRGLGEDLAPLARLAEILAAGVAAARIGASPDGESRRPGDPGTARGAGIPGRRRLVTAETVLWALWEASGHATRWRERALAGGARGRRADRDLDAVVALFDLAAGFVDRLPLAGPQAFLDHVIGQDVADDTLRAATDVGATVMVGTAQEIAGGEWELVVVAGLQEGVWPDLRVRGTLLGSQRLVDLLAGRPLDARSALAAVRHDETRLLHVAVSRARRSLLLTAVRNDDEQPSAFLDLVDPRDDDTPRPYTEVPRPATLGGLVGELRQAVRGDDEDGRLAARQLAYLARHGVAGAHPDDWWPLRDVSDDRPVRPPGTVVRLSPSKVEQFANCPLAWLLRTHGGDYVTIHAAGIGTLVHEVAAAHPDDTPAQVLHQALDAHWPRLGLTANWITEREQAQAHDMLDRYLAYLADAAAGGWTREAAERRVDALIGTARVVGQIDRVERGPDGRLRLIDLKTGATVKTDVARHPQLAVYQLAVAEGGEPLAGAALVRLGKNAPRANGPLVQPPLTGEDRQWAHDLLAGAATGMADGTFLVTEGDHCRTCAATWCCPLKPEGGSP